MGRGGGRVRNRFHEILTLLIFSIYLKREMRLLGKSVMLYLYRCGIERFPEKNHPMWLVNEKIFNL